MRQLIFSLLLIPTAALAAPPSVTHFFPAGVQRGQEATVTAAGSFTTWPTKVWSSHPGVQVTPAEEKSKLKVTIDAATPPGRYWLRCYDAEGAAKLKPLLVGMLAEQAEADANDKLTEALALAGNVTVNGRFEKGGDVDCYSIELKQGQTLVASLVGNRELGSQMDSVLQVCSSTGFVLAQNDDARGIDPQVVYPVVADGKYIVRCFCFPKTPNSTIGFAGNAAYVYRLTVTAGSFIDHALPLAVQQGASANAALFGFSLTEPQQSLPITPEEGKAIASLWHAEAASSLSLPVVPHASLVADESASAETPQAIAHPATISGRIESPKDADVFRITAKKDEKLTFRVEADGLGYALDPWLSFADAEGKVIADVDDPNRSLRDLEMKRTIPADGDYLLTVRDAHRHGGFRHVYRLTIEETKPRFKLKLAAESIVVTAGKPAELTVNVERLDGFGEAVEITAHGLPDHVTAAAVTSAKDGETAKAVKLKLEATATASSSEFQVIGKSGETEVIAAVAIENLSAEHNAAWLTVVPK